MPCSIKEVIEHVIRNPSHYPGPHLKCQPRTTRALAQLSCERQALLIWDAMCALLRENLNHHNSIVLRKFGTFSFEQKLGEVENKHGQQKTTCTLIPCFMPHDRLRTALTRYANKDAIQRNRSQFQQGPLKTIFLNENTIAAGCYYTTELVQRTLDALFAAIIDLTKRDEMLCLNFGVAKLRINHANLEAISCDPRLQSRLFEEVTKQKPLSDTWKKRSSSQSMREFIKRPPSAGRVAERELCRNLSVMSLDLNTCVKAN